MMIDLRRGDILAADTEALVNTVNCVGIMGRGIALQFRKAFPENFRIYEAVCARKELRPGEMLVFETGQMTAPRYIINFPTKRHWRGKSSLRDIETGLIALVGEISSRSIESIAIPPLGCGLGGLDWADVKPMIEAALSRVPHVRAIIYEPNGAPDAAVMAKTRSVPNMTPGRAALIHLTEKYLTGLMSPFVSLLEMHKLMYFMQEAGEGLKLTFEPAKYGPYAENLRHVLNDIEGHFLTGYADGGDEPMKPLELLPGAVEEAGLILREHPETLTRSKRVAELFKGFETPIAMELLATVHWVGSREEQTQSMEQLIELTHRWNARKLQFSGEQIAIAADALVSKGWLSPLSHAS